MDRKYPRFDAALPTIKINDLGAESQGLYGFLLNVSERGFCARVPLPPAMGNCFNFEVALPDGGRATGTAQCRWTRSEQGPLSWTCGGEILGVAPVDAERWDAYVRGLADLNRTV